MMLAPTPEEFGFTEVTHEGTAGIGGFVYSPL